MKRMTSSAALRVSLMLSLLIALSSTAFAESGADYGASGAAATASSWNVEQMLRYAVEDEYFARAEYVAVMKEFGTIRPFSNIKNVEDQHIEGLAAVYAARKMAMPVDDAASRISIPATLTEAYKTGEKAEIDNIAMYEAFLKSPLMSRSENADLRKVFDYLRKGSVNHLRAFRNQLGR